MERYLRVNLLGPGLCLIKKNLPGLDLTNFEKHCSKWSLSLRFPHQDPVSFSHNLNKGFICYETEL